MSANHRYWCQGTCQGRVLRVASEAPLLPVLNSRGAHSHTGDEQGMHWSGCVLMQVLAVAFKRNRRFGACLAHTSPSSPYVLICLLPRLNNPYLPRMSERRGEHRRAGGRVAALPAAGAARGPVPRPGGAGRLRGAARPPGVRAQRRDRAAVRRAGRGGARRCGQERGGNRAGQGHSGGQRAVRGQGAAGGEVGGNQRAPGGGSGEGLGHGRRQTVDPYNHISLYHPLTMIPKLS